MISTDKTAAMIEVIACEIWRYNECPWDFNSPPEGMAQLQKQIAIDQAKGIVIALAKHNQERAKEVARFVMTGERS